MNFIAPEGKPVVHMEQWVTTLSQDEQHEFAQAKERQRAFRAETVANGNLKVAVGSYEWKDENSAKINKPNDPVWLKYWDQYIKETGMKFNITEIKT